MKKLMMVAVLVMLASPAFAALKDCGELKSEIDARIQANGARNYSLEIVPNADVKDGKVVGSCEGGTKKIIYQRVK